MTGFVLQVMIQKMLNQADHCIGSLSRYDSLIDKVIDLNNKDAK